MAWFEVSHMLGLNSNISGLCKIDHPNNTLLPLLPRAPLKFERWRVFRCPVDTVHAPGWRAAQCTSLRDGPATVTRRETAIGIRERAKSSGGRHALDTPSVLP